MPRPTSAADLQPAICKLHTRCASPPKFSIASFGLSYNDSLLQQPSVALEAHTQKFRQTRNLRRRTRRKDLNQAWPVWLTQDIDLEEEEDQVVEVEVEEEAANSTTGNEDIEVGGIETRPPV